MNTVVNTYNWNEDMTKYILKYQPKRWKVFQCLLIEGENCTTSSNDNSSNDIDSQNSIESGDKSESFSKSQPLRDGTKFVISNEKFEHFLNTHKNVDCLVPENNETMRVKSILYEFV